MEDQILKTEREIKAGSKLDRMTDHELMVLLVKKQSQNARDQKITAIACTVLGVIFAAAFVLLIPKAVIALNEVSHLTSEAEYTLQQIDDMTAQAQTSLSNIDTMVANVNSIVTDNTDYVNDAMRDLNSIDFEGLNQAISDLESVVEPLAKLFGRK